ncbi:MAG: hypothetical protein Fur0032_02040 [Terrimicrobiaceae bacterium]
MRSVEIFLSEGERTRRQRRRLILSIILIVIGIHVLAAIVATVVVVARYMMPPPAEFVVQKDIRLPAKEREHRMNMAAFDALTPKPSFSDKVLSARPAEFALPDLPQVPLDQMLPLDPAEVVSDQVNSLVGTSGVAAGGQGSGGGLGGMGTGFSFLGVQSNGRRILLLFDVSESVTNKAAKSGMPLSKIKEETLALIDKLPASSRFGIIQFSQNYKVFRPELVPASDAHRAEVRDWVQNEWVETGRMPASRTVVSNPEGVLGVLKRAATMQPDVIFLISDGSFQRGLETIPWEEVEKAVKDLPVDGAEVPIHFIGFQMKPTDKREMGLISRKTGGKLREIK